MLILFHCFQIDNGFVIWFFSLEFFRLLNFRLGSFLNIRSDLKLASSTGPCPYLGFYVYEGSKQELLIACVYCNFPTNCNQSGSHYPHYPHSSVFTHKWEGNVHMFTVKPEPSRACAIFCQRYFLSFCNFRFLSKYLSIPVQVSY